MSPPPSPFDPPQAASVLRLPRRPKAVAFDLDGTLIDSEAFVQDAWFTAAPRFGIELTQAQFLSFVGKHRGATEELMLQYFGGDFPLKEFFADVATNFGDAVAPLRAGVGELLEQLDGMGTPYAVVTSSGAPWVERHFKHHDLVRRFSAIVTRDDVENRKPHPEPYLRAARLLGHDPAEMLAIEDSPTGAMSAADAGMMTVVIPDLLQPDEATRRRVLHVGASLHDVVAALSEF